MTSTPRAPRQRSRQLALQVLYAADLGEHAERGDSMDEVFERVANHFDLPRGARAFALELAQGTAANLVSIDALLAEHATNWKVSRMAAVDRNVLRLAIFELTHTETPVSIVLDEAIELARRFGADSSPVFVNGVLDAIAHHVRPPETKPVADDSASGRLDS